jgi:adenine/guanine phosphoribosyltransferase-like PRPP-binding protein
MEKVIDMYGSYIARICLKKSGLISYNDIYAILTPEENAGVKLGELMSNQLSLNRFPTITIKRNIIEELTKAKQQVKIDKIIKRLDNFSCISNIRGKKLIIVDDGINQGNTLKGLTKIADYFNSEILCYIVLLIRNKEFVSKFEEKPLISMYQFYYTPWRNNKECIFCKNGVKCRNEEK